MGTFRRFLFAKREKVDETKVSPDVSTRLKNTNEAKRSNGFNDAEGYNSNVVVITLFVYR